MGTRQESSYINAEIAIDSSLVADVRLRDVERDYIDGKQTLTRLSAKYGVCVKTVWNMLGAMRHKRVISKDKNVIVEMDATYWGRKFGIVVIKDALRSKVLWYEFIRSHEKVEDYVEGVDWLQSHGFKIWGVVCDGLKGLLKSLRPIPVQMCHFHMISIVRRYLTNKPDLGVARELSALVKTLSRKDEKTFMEELKMWHSRHEDMLKEKSVDNFGKKHFTRPRLQSAYLSIKRHAPWLWTFEKFKDRTIPNTNAGIESSNARLKTTMRIHSGITAERRKKLIEIYMATHY